MKSAAVILLCAGAAFAQQVQPNPQPSIEEQQDLMRALSEGSSPVDLIRGLEAHLARYPNTVQRAELERSLANAAVESNDIPRIARYGESAVATSADNFLLLDRLAYAFLILGGEENAGKAYRYARAFEDLVDKMPVATGKDAARRQDEQERAVGHALMYQARARTIQKDDQDALRLAARAFSAYPSEETARE